jgi:hypothetical protein
MINRNNVFRTVQNFRIVQKDKSFESTIGNIYQTSSEKRIADNALVALCLMIAQSNPKEKDVMIKVIVNLINKNN